MNYVLRISLMALIVPMGLQSTQEPLGFYPEKSTEQSGNNCIIKFGDDNKGNVLGIAKNKAGYIGGQNCWIFFKNLDPDSVIQNGDVYDGGDYGGRIFVNKNLILTPLPNTIQTQVKNLKDGRKVVLDSEDVKNAVLSDNNAVVLVEHSLTSALNTSAFKHVWNINYYNLPFNKKPEKSWLKALFSCCNCHDGIEGQNIYTSKEKVGPLALNSNGTELFFGVNGNLYRFGFADDNQSVRKLIQEKNEITSIVVPNHKHVIYGTTGPRVIIANKETGNVIAQLRGNKFPIQELVVGNSSDHGPIIAALGQEKKYLQKNSRLEITHSEVCIWKNMLPQYLMQQKIGGEKIEKFANISFSYK
jgi:hypothetical protein